MLENYRMILVDDEDDVRGRIVSKIKDESGFTVVGKAGNGYDALELIEKHQPHIVLTDIKMPFIDGIELARIIRRDYPTTKVAFISGYDEFDYARQAIELNVVSYLMKPITSEELDKFLLKLKTILDEEIDAISNTEKLMKRYDESIPLLIDTHLNSFLLKNELDDNDLNILKSFGLNLQNGTYVTAYIGIDKHTNNHFEDIEKSKIFINNLLDRIFEEYQFKNHFLVADGIILTVMNSKTNLAKEIDLELFEIIKYAEQYGNIKLRIGVSNLFEDFKNFPLSFKEADEALKYSRYFNMGQIIYSGEIQSKEKKHIVIDENLITTFEYSMKYGTQKEVEDSLRKMMDFTKAENKDYILDHQLLVINLVNSILNFTISIGVNISEIDDGNILEKMLSFSNPSELLTWIKALIFRLRDLNLKSQSNKTDVLIEDAVNYIESNFNDTSISLESVSDYLNISVSYLSMLFSKKKGITFNKFLIRVRMEKAKELLKFTDQKVINIATMVGYNEVYYFSHSFKKYTGMTPREFKANG
ncbi:MAG: response regulator [Firmicutes bacterium]|nr:response regulator [Bacillota bacterium]